MEGVRRRNRLNELERRYKQKLLHLKMPHLLITSQSRATANKQDQEESEEGQLGLGGERPAGDMIISQAPSAGGPSEIASPAAPSFPSSSSTTGIAGGNQALPSNLDLSILSSQPNLLSRALAPLGSLHAAPTASGLDNFLLSSLVGNNFGNDLVAQLRSYQQYDQSMNIAALLELEGRRSLVASAQTQPDLHRLLGASLLNDRSPSLQPRQSTHVGVGSSGSTGVSQQLQDYLRAEQTFRAAQQRNSLSFVGAQVSPASTAAGNSLLSAATRVGGGAGDSRAQQMQDLLWSEQSSYIARLNPAIPQPASLMASSGTGDNPRLSALLATSSTSLPSSSRSASSFHNSTRANLDLDAILQMQTLQAQQHQHSHGQTFLASSAAIAASASASNDLQQKRRASGGLGSNDPQLGSDSSRRRLHHDGSFKRE